MLKCARATFFAAVLCFGFSAYAQPLPCPAGTLANVLGTDCSVGSIIFNFGTDFQGFTFSGGLFGQITPADIGFVPVQSDNKVGFRLVLNFVDGNSNPVFGDEHFVTFSYIPQAAPGSEIRVQSLSIDANVQATPGGTGVVQAFDFQSYPNSGPVSNFAGIDIRQGVSLANRLSNSQILEVPGLLSVGSGSPGFATTQLDTFSTGGSSDSLTSATFLYTTGPLVPTPGLAALSYTNIDLPGVAATFVSNITNSGRMVGSYQDFAGNFHGYVEDPDGSFVTIDVPGAPDTFADGLNERGDVVGGFTGADGHTHGFLQHDGVISTFSVPGARFTAPIAINNKGQIAGEYRSADLSFHGFLLSDGAFVTIDEGPGTGRFADSAAFAINNSGEIGGTFFDPNTFRAYLLKNNSVTVIDVPGQGDTTIEGINDRADSVGIFNDINLAQHGFLLSHGTFRTVDFPGGNSSSALGTNDSGKIVGEYLTPDGNTHSFLATPAFDDSMDHRPTTSSTNPSQPKPACGDEEWRSKHDLLRNAGLCHGKH
jgi:probable HAF family extracellular repeat protein